MPSDEHQAIQISQIIGEQLSAVTFVQDYIQLHFDGPVFTAVTLPSVQSEGVTVKPGEPGYRDALCALIARRVTAASIVPGQRAQIEFADGSAVVVSLAPESYSPAGEAVIVTDTNGRTWGVW